MVKKKTTAEFIEQSKKVHNDKFDYSKVNYVNSKKNVIIICPFHGEFQQTPNTHLKFKATSGRWIIQDILLRPHSETNFNPSYFRTVVPMDHPLPKKPDQYDFLVGRFTFLFGHMQFKYPWYINLCVKILETVPV